MKSFLNRWRRTVFRRVFGDKFSARVYGHSLASRLRSGMAPGLADNGTLTHAEKLVSSGDVVIDVGALGGDWSYTMGRRVGTGGAVFGVEADAFFAAVLESAFKDLQLPQVKIVHTALGAAQGEAWLVTKSAEGDELLGFAHIGETPGVNSSSVPMTTLDSLFKVHPRLRETKLLKIDTEGYEPIILQGATEFLTQVKPIVVCEVHSQWLERFGWSPSKLLALLTSLGYRPSAANGRPADSEQLIKRLQADGEFSDDIMFHHESSPGLVMV